MRGMPYLLRCACLAFGIYGALGAGSALADDGFERWLKELREEAQAQGISETTLERALADVAPIERVIELDRSQPEFTRTFWSYMDRAVSADRVERGRSLLAEHRDLLEEVRAQYGVQPRFLVAFWGLETNFGEHLGSFPVISSLATLAYDERRSAFFRAQLLHALRIVDEGHAAPEEMMGSWAGAMGHLQFIPSTFVNHAVDATGDGRKDIWSNLADVFASGANFLNEIGWNGNQIWGREVRLPDDFDWSLAALSEKKPLAAWAELGVRRADGGALPQADMEGSIVLPQGHAGPAFLVYDNFRAIMNWNRSVNYAIAVGHLADRIVGLPPLQTGRGADNAPLSREQAQEIQRRLNALGFEAGPVDGVPGSQTRAAIRAFQQSAGLPADGHPSPRVLEQLRGHGDTS